MVSRSKNDTPDPGAPSASRRTFDPLAWHFWWAIALIGGAGALLLILGGVSAHLLLSLVLMATPSVIGALGWFSKTGRLSLLALWAAAATTAAWTSGGLGGPFTVFCLAPALASIVLAAPFWSGCALSIASLLAVAAVTGLQLAGPIPDEPVRSWLTVAALAAVAGAIVGAFGVARPGFDPRRQSKDATLLAFSALAQEAGALALTLNAFDRAETILGRPLAALPQRTLEAGIVSGATRRDQPDVQAAIDLARRDGAAEVTFAPARAPTTRLTLTLRRAEAGILAALIRPSAVAASEPAAVPTGPERDDVAPIADQTADLARRLAEAEAAQAAAETARTRAEESASARARFLANMSHELRTPLNAIMGFSDMMRSRMFGELAPKYGEYAELIHESGGHLLDLINDVLDVSKLEAHRYTLAEETFDAREPVNGALRLMRLQAHDAGIKLRATLPKEALMVHADRRAIKQMALNLLSNALKFTPKAGFVVLTLQAAGRDLELIVADTGVGIAKADLERLGRPFEQAGGAQDQARGTGLGLSLVSAFAALHRGGLTLESKLGEGTAATVRLPVLTTAQAAPAEAAPVEAAPLDRDPVQTAPTDAQAAPGSNASALGEAFNNLPQGVETDFEGTPASLLALVQKEERPGGYRSLSLDLGSRR